MGCRRKKKYCAGDFNRTITILKPETVKTPGDYDISHASVVAIVRAKVKTLSGVAWHNGVATQEGNTHMFAIRFTPKQISKNYIISYRDVFYRIDTVDNVEEEDDYLEIRATKRGASTNKANWG